MQPMRLTLYAFRHAFPAPTATPHASSCWVIDVCLAADSFMDVGFSIRIRIHTLVLSMCDDLRLVHMRAAVRLHV